MNRDMELFRRKVGRIHLSAGSCQPGFLEWNAVLDPHAIVRVLSSDLPVAIYPCGTRDGAFTVEGTHLLAPAQPSICSRHGSPTPTLPGLCV